MSNINSNTLYKPKSITQYNESWYYTVPEVAVLLGVGKSYIYAMILQNRIKAIRLSERRIRISVSALEEFIKQEMDNTFSYHYNKGVVQPPKRGRKPNGTA